MRNNARKKQINLHFCFQSRLATHMYRLQVPSPTQVNTFLLLKEDVTVLV